MNKPKKLETEDIKNNTKIYDTYVKVWRMEDAWLPGNKENNFSEMMKLVELTGIPISGATCLDVGCGTGDLSLFLRQRGSRDYLGIDIYGLSLKKARARYPHETFILDDFLNTKIKRKFDYGFCSGALTVKLKTMDNYEYLQAIVEKMWRLTKIGLTFNFLTDDEYLQDSDLFFYSIKKVKKICEKIIGQKAHISYEKTVHVKQVHFYLYRDAKQL